jgi:endonuclease/exonuclease/phosphatase family metal-dependent hydrolase
MEIIIKNTDNVWISEIDKDIYFSIPRFLTQKQLNYISNEWGKLKEHVNKIRIGEYETKFLTKKNPNYYIENFIEKVNQEELINYKKKNTIRLITFNVHCFLNGFFDRYNNKNIINASDVANLINNLDTDIILIQEYAPIYDDNDIRLGKFFDFMKEYWGCVINDGHKFITDEKTINCMAFLCNTKFNKFDENKLETKVLKYEDRILRGFIEYTIFYNKEEITIINVHPSPTWFEDILSTKEQLREIFNHYNSKYKVYEESIIIAGDYNIDGFTYTGFVDILKENGKNDFTSWGNTAIDKIFVSKYFYNNYDIVNLEILKVGLSDHFPILFDFEKK